MCKDPNPAIGSEGRLPVGSKSLTTELFAQIDAVEGTLSC
jgi:hypothetical protein